MRTITKAIAFLFGSAHGSTALAADLPPAYKAAPVVTPPPFSWTGFYLGANLGWGWANADVTIGGVTGTGKIDGVIGGGQIGYNWQAGNIVWGVEVDGQASGQKKTWNGTVLGVGWSETDKVPWFATFRGRVGYAADQWLFYVTGGGAYAEGKIDISINGLGSASWSNSHLGWSAGAGIENAINRNWSWKLEYLHFDTGSFSTNILGLPATARLKDDIVRAGVNYRF
jgi:outer membrane immunogenic protein